MAIDVPRYDVIVDGSALPEFDPAVVLAQLQQQLKLPEAKARLLLAAKSVTVKRAVSNEIARAYCQRLQTIGLATRIAETSGVDGPSTPAPSIPVRADYFSLHGTPLENSTRSSEFRRALNVAVLHSSMVACGYLSVVIISTILLLAYIAHFSYLLVAPPVLFSITVFLMPLVTIALFVSLILRPFLLRPNDENFAHEIQRTEQPQLFDLIGRLCSMLAVAFPAKISVATHADNKLSLLPGAKSFMRGEYQLTLSLPLIDAATIKQFGSILGGDLAIGTPRTLLRYRWLQQFFHSRIAGCVAGCDLLHRWIDKFLGLCERTHFAFLRFPLRHLLLKSNAALQAIARRLDAIEQRFSRAQQLECDRYRAIIGGTHSVGDLLILEHKLQLALTDATALNNKQHDSHRVTDDLAALTQHYFFSLDENLDRQIKKNWQTGTIARRHEPATARERIERAGAEPRKGILSSDESVTTLLQQRQTLGLQTTLLHYQDIGWDFDANKLIPADELTYIATQDILRRQQAEIYFNNWFKSFRFWNLADYQLIHDMPLQEAAQQLNVCINEIRRLTPDRAALFFEYQRLQNQIREIMLGQHVLAAGKKFSFRAITYDGATLQPVLEEKQQLLAKVVEKLSIQEVVMGGRITLGFRLCGQAERDVILLHDALRLLRDCGPRLDKLALDAYQLEQLLERHYRRHEADYRAAISRLEQRIDETLMLLFTRLSSISYPFDHEHRPLKFQLDAELDKLKISDEKFAVLQRANCTLATLYALNERLSMIAADYGTIAEEAYRIESIKLINSNLV